MLRRIQSFVSGVYAQIGYAASWKLFDPLVFGLTFALTFLARLVGIPSAVTVPILQNIAISLIAHLMCYLTLALLVIPQLLLPKRYTLGVLTGVMAAGAVRGLTVDFLIRNWVHDALDLTLYRVVNGIFLFSLVAIVSSYTVSEVTRRLALLRELRRLTLELESELNDNHMKIEGWYNQLAANLKVRLSSQLQKHLSESDTEIAAGLKEQVAEVIRPLSHELMNDSPTLEPQNKVVIEPGLGFALVKTALEMHWEIYPKTMIFLGAVVCFPTYLHLLGWASMWHFAFTSVLMLIGVQAANFAYSKLEQNKTIWAKLAIYFAGIFVCTFPASLYAAYLTDLSFAAYTVAAALFSLGVAVASWLMSVALAARKAMVEDQRRLEDVTAELKWLVARTSALMWERQRDLSRILHGPVQGALSAAAIRLDLAKGDPSELARIVRESRVSIMDAVSAITAPHQNAVAVEQSFAQIIDGWEGVVDIRVDAEAETFNLVNTDSSGARMLVDLIQEAVGNAARHGEARSITVSLRMEANLLRAEIIDDGRGIEPGSRRGLGSRLLDECTVEWQRSNAVNGGVRLTFAIPIASQLVAQQ